MSRKMLPPLVAICGRPNVGKSTLYNRLTGKSRAIVHDEAGITRDRHVAAAEWNGRKFRVVDTGGIVESPLDPVVKKMQDQVRVAIKESRVVVFVVDGREPLTRTDYELRDELLKQGKPIVLAVNKLDNEALESERHEFHELGVGEPIAISATHGLGTQALVDAILAHLPAPPEGAPETPAGEDAERDSELIHVAVVGRPNAGKSSFINAILNEERVIVDEAPGTTRDAIDVEFQWKDRSYVLIDTAGLRKKAGIKKHVEHFSVARSLRAVRRADVCLILIDATEGPGEQDVRIASYCAEQGRAMAIVWTKWDLVKDKEGRLAELKDELDRRAPFLHYAPMLTISNTTRTRLFKTIDLVDRVAQEARKRVSTGKLNQFLSRVKGEHRPTGGRGRAPKILYMTQASAQPTVFVLFVNQRKLFHFSYLRFLENRLREEYGFEGVPIRLELREETPT
jgi:GTP-binding protein